MPLLALILLLAACGGGSAAAPQEPGLTIQTVPAAGSTPPSPTTTPSPADLRGFIFPITGACLPKGDQLMPNAPPADEAARRRRLPDRQLHADRQADAGRPQRWRSCAPTSTTRTSTRRQTSASWRSDVRVVLRRRGRQWITQWRRHALLPPLKCVDHARHAGEGRQSIAFACESVRRSLYEPPATVPPVLSCEPAIRS